MKCLIIFCLFFLNISFLLSQPPPENIRIEISGDHVLLNWAEVDTTVSGEPIDVDYYIIYNSLDPYGEFSFLNTTPDTTFIDNSAALLNDMMFYQLESFVGTRQELNIYNRKNQSADSIITYRPEASSVVGFVKYSCQTVYNTTNLNLIVLTMDDPSIYNIETLAYQLAGHQHYYYLDMISVWDTDLQFWQSSVWFFSGWLPNFPLYQGDIIKISVVQNLSFYSVGALPEPISYDLITVENDSNLNMISIPLNRNDITDVSNLANSMGGSDYIDQISRWNNPSQNWDSSTYFFGFWTPDFPMTIGDPFMISAVQDYTWPSRSCNNIKNREKIKN